MLFYGKKFCEILFAFSALDHHFDGAAGPGPRSLKSIQSLLQREPVGDQGLDIHLECHIMSVQCPMLIIAHLATGHHGYGCGVAVGVSEYAANVNLKTITNMQTAIIEINGNEAIIEINVKTSLTAALTIGIEISGFPSPTRTRHPPDLVA